LDLSRRVGRGGIWLRQWERLKQEEQGSTISLKAAVQQEHWLRALIYNNMGEQSRVSSWPDGNVLINMLYPTKVVAEKMRTKITWIF
jgi:hypothetical protein